LLIAEISNWLILYSVNPSIHSPRLETRFISHRSNIPLFQVFRSLRARAINAATAVLFLHSISNKSPSCTVYVHVLLSHFNFIVNFSIILL